MLPSAPSDGLCTPTLRPWRWDAGLWRGTACTNLATTGLGTTSDSPRSVRLVAAPEDRLTIGAAALGADAETGRLDTAGALAGRGAGEAEAPAGRGPGIADAVRAEVDLAACIAGAGGATGRADHAAGAEVGAAEEGAVDADDADRCGGGAAVPRMRALMSSCSAFAFASACERLAMARRMAFTTTMTATMIHV